MWLKNPQVEQYLVDYQAHLEKVFVIKKIHLQYEDGFLFISVKIRSESTKFFWAARLTKPMLGVEFCIKITVFAL